MGRLIQKDAEGKYTCKDTEAAFSKLAEFEELEALGKIVKMPIAFDDSYYEIWNQGENCGYENVVVPHILRAIDCQGKLYSDDGFDENVKFWGRDQDSVFYDFEKAKAEAQRRNLEECVPQVHFEGTPQKNCQNCRYGWRYLEDYGDCFYSDGKEINCGCEYEETGNECTNIDYACRYWAARDSEEEKY